MTYSISSAEFIAVAMRGEWSVRLAEIVLWGSLAFALYAYGLYPLALWLLSRCARGSTRREDADGASCPSVTLLIRAQRDEHSIIERLQNVVAADYPRGQLQVLVACNGEDDLTALLARSFDRRQVEVVQFPNRGEAFLLNACLRQARGEILVFSDARTLMRSDAIRLLVGHYCNPTVGGVCGKFVVSDLSGGRRLDRPNVRFESFVEQCESRLEAVPAVHAGIYSIRKNLCVPLPENEPVDDFAVAAAVRRHGFRLLYDETAIATAAASAETHGTPCRGRSQARKSTRFAVVVPPVDVRRGALCCLFWMHRVMRRVCPGFLIAAFVSNACLSDDPFYLHMLLFHELFYIGTLAGLFVTGGSRGSLAALLKSFRAKSKPFQSNLALNSGRVQDVATRSLP
jgi:hypothetical protein